MSGSYYGDYATSTTVYMVFDSFAASSGASSAVTNFANTDVQIYKDGSITQRSSASGITVTTSFDGSTGLQMVAIDLSDNTDAGFYAAGHEYSVAIADITIDSQTVRFWLGAFSIERVVKVNVTKWAGTATTLTSSLPDVNTKTITAGIIAAATFAANALDAVWSTATRVLTAGTNIALAKGTGVTGLNDLAAADVRTAVGLASANLDTQIAAIPAADAVAVGALVVETGLTLKNALRGLSAMLFGKVSGAQTGTETFRNAVADDKNRIVMTDDSSGNRTVVTTDFT